MTLILLFIGISTFLVCTLIFDILFGSRMKQNYLSEYYRHINGMPKKQENVPQKKKNTVYVLDRKVYLKYSFGIALLIFFAGIIFFRSVGSAIFFSLGGFVYPRYLLKRKIERRREILTIQFREALQSISNSLKAGSSLQVAIERCFGELKLLYRKKKDKPIVEELELIVYDLQIGKSLTEALQGFKRRVHMEDIDSFVNAAILTEKTGGNLTEVMSNVVEMISDKIEVKREISTLTAGKRAEGKLLTFMPVGVVLILSMVAPSYMAPMYETFAGKLLMIFGVVLLLINYLIGRKIINIEV